MGPCRSPDPLFLTGRTDAALLRPRAAVALAVPIRQAGRSHRKAVEFTA